MMSTSFPFLAIARETRVPYGDVIQIAEAIGKEYLQGSLSQVTITGLERKAYNRHKGTPVIGLISQAVLNEERRRGRL